jgi:uncharacterized protein involved in exopolysaccharide biosynthesis
MKWFRLSLILLFWLALGAAGGFVGFKFMPNKYVSEGEVALNSETLASAGLAQFTRTSLMGSVDRELASQLFDSITVREHAAKVVGGLSPKDVRDNLSVKSRDDSPMISIKVAASTPERAAALATALIEKAIEVDADKRARMARAAVGAVQTRLTEVEKELAGVNEQIRKYNLDMGVMLSNEAERQQTVALTIADCEQRLATLLVEQASLTSRLKQTTDLVTAFTTKGTLPSGFDFDDQEKNYSLAEVRKKLLDQGAELASLKSRYGNENPSVLAIQAQLESTKHSVSELLTIQQQRLETRLKDNELAVKIFRDKIALTEKTARETDLSLDPVFAGMKTRREALQAAYNNLSNRLTELLVFENAKSNSLHKFSDPKVPDGPSMLKIATAFAIGLFAGGFIGLCHCLLSAGLVTKLQAIVKHEAR